MMYKFCLFLILNFALLNLTEQQKLDLTTHTTKKYKLQTESWLDLFGVEVKCPNYGVLKNFVLRRQDGYFWYEFKCYSSKTQNVDYGEPILKVLAFQNKYKYGINIRRYIDTLNDIPIACEPDYAINSFKLTNVNGVIQRDLTCYGLKSTGTTGFDKESNRKTGDTFLLDTLVDSVIGPENSENDDVIGYPLRGFKYIVDTSSNKNYPTVYTKYSYSKLRNMKTVRDKYKEMFKKQREANTQAD